MTQSRNRSSFRTALPFLSLSSARTCGIRQSVRIVEKEWDELAETRQTTADRRFLWDGLAIAEERSGTNGGTVVKRFYSQGVEIVTGSSAGTYTYRTDHLGSIREVIDDQGDLVARFNYSPWGEIETVSGSFDLDFAFTGHFLHHPTGLHLAPFRAYDATTGRWISRDPVGNAEFLPEGPNLYGYVGNNPILYWDPFGLATWWNPFTWGADEWGAAGQGALGGAAAYADGISTAAAMNGLFGVFDPNLFSGFYDPCDWSTKFSHGLGQAAFASATAAFILPQGAARGGMQAVTHWGPQGMSSLRSGDWVMTGGSSFRNWWTSGSAQQGYRFQNSITQTAATSSLKPIPGSWGVGKNFYWAEGLSSMIGLLYLLGFAFCFLGILIDSISLRLTIKKNLSGVGPSGLPVFGLVLYVIGVYIIPGDYIFSVHKGYVFFVLFLFHMISQLIAPWIHRKWLM